MVYVPHEGEPPDHLEDILERSLAEIDIDLRVLNKLEDRGIFTVNDLLNMKRQAFMSILGLGKEALQGVLERLEAIGFFRDGTEPKADMSVRGNGNGENGKEERMRK